MGRKSEVSEQQVDLDIGHSIFDMHRVPCASPLF